MKLFCAQDTAGYGAHRFLLNVVLTQENLYAPGGDLITQICKRI